MLAGNKTVAKAKALPSPWRVAYRIFSWLTLAGAVLTLVLILRQASPPQVQADPRAAARLESKIQQVESALASGQPQALHVDEAELNSYLGSHLELNPGALAGGGAVATPSPSTSGVTGNEPTVEEVKSSVRDVKINLIDNRVRAYVLFDFHGKDLSLVLEGRLRTENGYLRLEPTSGQIGSLPIPRSSLERAVQRLFDSPENREKFRLPPDVSDIHIENGEVVVSYR